MLLFFRSQALAGELNGFGLIKGVDADHARVAVFGVDEVDVKFLFHFSALNFVQLVGEDYPPPPTPSND